MAAQDPSLRIVGEPLSTEPYAIGLPPGRPEWVRYVNAVLEEVRESGRWDDLYARWLADVLDDSPGPPAPVYED
jgi:polar amino acid transport system substrate-binding protein